MYSWYVLWVNVQVNLQSSDRLIKKIQTESGAIPVMMLQLPYMETSCDKVDRRV